jgi:hypothetical protein
MNQFRKLATYAYSHMLRAMPAISIYNFFEADEELLLLLPASPPPKQGFFFFQFCDIEIWQDIPKNSTIIVEFTL